MTATYVAAEARPQTGAHEVAAKPSLTRPQAGRDRFLDVLRAIALTRVIVWHTFGLAVISWIVATMPIMFFVAGTLLYRSLDGRAARDVLQKRLRRLLVPFWFFGSIVLTVTSLVHVRQASDATDLSAHQVLAWIVPLVNPTASTWEAGWASAPLWYLRCYLWVLLLSPLLMWAWKRFGPRVVGIPVIVVVLTQVVADRLNPGPNALLWVVGDLALYTIFVLIGFANAEGRLDGLTGRDLIEWVVIGGAGAAVAWQLFPSADGVANHSYPTLAWLGVAWLAGLSLLRPWLMQLAEQPAVELLIRWMTARAMSIYLWHSPVIVGTYALVAALGFQAPSVVLLVLVMAGTVLLSTATGWIEDVAGGRPARLIPGMPQFTLPTHFAMALGRNGIRSVATGVVACTIVLGLVVQPSGVVQASEESGLALPPAPSGRPDPNAATPPALPLVEADTSLAERLDAWRSEYDVAGVVVGISRPAGERQVVTSGTNEDGSALLVDEPIAVTSITKTFTAALVLQLRDEGLLRLDDPIPVLDAVPTFAHSGTITYRQLLNHSSGLAPYQESAGYDPSQPLDAVSAVRMAGDTPLQWTPGTVGGYSNSGYLTLGLLIEQLTGESFEVALEQRVLVPLGLTMTDLVTTPSAGWVGDSAGGMSSTVEDLLTWAESLYRDGEILSEESLAEMVRIDLDLSSGLGAFPVCPCDEVDGVLSPRSVGHNGGSVTMQFSAADGTILVVSFTESFWTQELTQSEVYLLLQAIREVAA